MVENDADTNPTTLDELRSHAREYFTACMTALDTVWEPEVGLVTSRHPRGTVRATSRYALGLLIRGEEGDRDRAVEALETVLGNQFRNDPDAVYYGTWARTPEEHGPIAEPDAYGNYDPNWREFVGTTLALIDDEFAEGLPDGLREEILEANRVATEGTLARDVPASYTNIALMRAYLIHWTAWRLGNNRYKRRVETFADAIYELFEPQGTFCEFNSPTYNRVSFNVLGQWVTGIDPESELHAQGREMEAALWKQVGQFYHAGLRQLGGPYDRCYRMDTEEDLDYVWLAAGGEGRDPFPESYYSDDPVSPTITTGSAILAVLGRGWRRLPEEVLPDIRSFQGERRIERTIDCADSQRRATAWHGESVAIGGFASEEEPYRGTGSQLHTGTLHWRVDEQTIGWGRLRSTVEQCPDVQAEKGKLRIERHDTSSLQFEFAAPGLTATAIQGERWTLPGMALEIRTNAEETRAESTDVDRVTVELVPAPGEKLQLTLELDPTV
jgi:hypothetical protein